jgi:hypothetical protein
MSTLPVMCAVNSDPLCFFFNDTATTEIYTFSSSGVVIVTLKPLDGL